MRFLYALPLMLCLSSAAHALPDGAALQIKAEAFAAARATDAKMREIAESFAEAGLPSGFHRAAAEVWERLAEWKDVAEPPEMAQVLERLLRRR